MGNRFCLCTAGRLSPSAFCALPSEQMKPLILLLAAALALAVGARAGPLKVACEDLTDVDYCIECTKSGATTKCLACHRDRAPVYSSAGAITQVRRATGGSAHLMRKGRASGAGRASKWPPAASAPPRLRSPAALDVRCALARRAGQGPCSRSRGPAVQHGLLATWAAQLQPKKSVLEWSNSACRRAASSSCAGPAGRGSSVRAPLAHRHISWPPADRRRRRCPPPPCCRRSARPPQRTTRRWRPAATPTASAPTASGASSARTTFGSTPPSRCAAGEGSGPARVVCVWSGSAEAQLAARPGVRCCPAPLGRSHPHQPVV